MYTTGAKSRRGEGGGCRVDRITSGSSLGLYDVLGMLQCLFMALPLVTVVQMIQGHKRPKARNQELHTQSAGGSEATVEHVRPDGKSNS